MYNITFGLCVKNAERTIKETFDSIVCQDFPHENMEIVIVEGGSSDKTLEALTDCMSKTDIKARLYCDNGLGLAVARQIVVEECNSDYILWTDSDVVLSKDFARKQLDFINKNPDICVAIGQKEYVELEGKNTANTINLFWCLLRDIYFGATICRLQAFKEVGGFDKRIKGASEDTDVVFRMTMAHWKMAINPEAKFSHKQRETLRDLVNRGAWYGYGGHFMGHKYEGLIKIPYKLPLFYFAWGLKLSSKAYKTYHRRNSFLIPLIFPFMSIGWCIGFIRAHLHGYGHSIKHHEIKKERVLSLLKELSKTK